MSTAQGGPVVVGLDTSRSALAAVRWATLEAAALRAPVQLVHAAPGEVDDIGRRALRDAADVALNTLRDNDINTDITVSTAVRRGTPVGVLLDTSRQARLLVVATHGIGRPLEGFSGSVAATLAGRCACPMVAVPRGGAEQVPDGAVVVGMDSAPESEPALEFAFDMAAAHRAKVIAVRAWSDGDGAPAAVPAQRHDSVIGYAEERSLADRLQPWLDKYPGVWVRPEVVRCPPADALIEHGAHARLVVVGARGTAVGLSGLLHRSTSQALLYRADFPVAVVSGVR